MTSRQRQEAVHTLVMHHGEVTTEEIARRVRVSLATIRRDLAALERRGLVERTWGGARVLSSVHYLESFSEAADQQASAKRAIAAAAAAMVEPGMVLGLSGGTTCTELARWLRGKDVTVVTNAVNAAIELYNQGRTRVILTGGTMNGYSYELVGELATEALHEHRLDLCFVGCSGITPDFGYSMRDRPEASVARAFRAVSARTIVLADHSKVGRRTLARFAPLSAVPTLITDRGISPDALRMLEREGVTVYLAETRTEVDSRGGSR
ncbi:MAG: DeoR/GlpR family DNA-binding transcription regulator [Trueperaceae bacterium]